MKILVSYILFLGVCFCVPGIAQEQIISMDSEPHYSRVFSNEYCRAYSVYLGRLEETKPVVHEHDWVRMTLGGSVEQAWGGTLYSSKAHEDPEGHIISFLDPVNRVSLRNPHSDPYQAMMVEILKDDDSRNRLYDPSVAHFDQTVGPGVDPHVSYANSLSKTSVEIMNVQLLGGDSKQLSSEGVGALLVAITDDLNLTYQQKDGEPKELHLSRGDVQWFTGSAPTLKNSAKETARFAVLEMK
jgi:hypothetical protein